MENEKLKKRMKYIRESIFEAGVWLSERKIDTEEKNVNGVSLDSCIYDIVMCADLNSKEPETWKDI